MGAYWVRFTDSDGVTMDLKTRCVSGNFYLERETYDPAFPLVVQVMRGPADGDDQ